MSKLGFLESHYKYHRFLCWPSSFDSSSFSKPGSLISPFRALDQSWVTLMSGILTPRPMGLALAPVVCVEILMPSLGSMDSCVADSASVAMPRKLDSSSTAEGFIWFGVGRNSFKYEQF
ncbi:hypothetical protein V6N13_098311 [Hibiscus sabdariffa]|uniref:Uncharacterized protein n=1 Tax=Hibiscus sabdariffa TaxID=183260 RepID=A0ABR2EDD8_9ROSI